MMRVGAFLGLVLMGACSTPAAESPAQVPWRCDAEAAQSLIGSNFAAVDFPAGANVRFVCTECAMTRDFRSDRLTIFYDRDSGIIERVQCV